MPLGSLSSYATNLGKHSPNFKTHADFVAGLGQAAIQIAQHIGAEIFVTVGSTAKEQLLISEYGIPIDHIFNSRDLSFDKGIMRMTKGRGVDVILNSLSGEALRRTWECTAMFGRFVEVGKRDILGNTGLEMNPFLRNITFIGINTEVSNTDGIFALLHTDNDIAYVPTKPHANG